jgi:predicted Zn-dependent protease
MQTKRILLAPLALLVLVLAGACATTGPRGEKSLILISDQQEKEIGQGVNQNIRGEFPVHDDAELTAYVSSVGERLVAVSERPEIGYEFTVLETEVVNAMAAPGGFVYVTTGLLTEARNEAELAGVLGHEIGHVVGRHSVKQIQLALGASLALSVITPDSEAWEQVVGLGTQVALTGYGRSQENEADTFGVLYGYRAGYDPHGMLTFLEKLQNLQDRELTKFEAFFSTHPRTGDRIDHVREELATLPSSGKELRVGEEEYNRHVADLR